MSFPKPEPGLVIRYLPPRFFAELHRRFVLLESVARSRRVPRTE